MNSHPSALFDPRPDFTSDPRPDFGSSRASQAVQAAAAAASQINQKLGMTSNSQPPLGGLPQQQGMSQIDADHLKLQERLLGLSKYTTVNMWRFMFRHYLLSKLMYSMFSKVKQNVEVAVYERSILLLESV